jgi:hypothetical protein
MQIHQHSFLTMLVTYENININRSWRCKKLQRNARNSRVARSYDENSTVLVEASDICKPLKHAVHVNNIALLNECPLFQNLALSFIDVTAKHFGGNCKGLKPNGGSDGICWHSGNKNSSTAATTC